MADDAFLHSLLKDAAQNFAAKAKETHETKSSYPASQAQLTQFLATIPNEEMAHNQRQLDQAFRTGMLVTNTKNPGALVSKKPDDDHSLTTTTTTTTRAVTGNNSVTDKEKARYHSFAAFTYADAVAIFFTHHLIFRGPKTEYERLSVGAIVLSRDADKVLLVQRGGADDPLAGKWEMPSSLCGDHDMTILHGLVRELCEGTGLMANKIVATTGYQELMLPSGQLCRKYAFVVEAGEQAVSLDPQKHRRCVWATEQNIAMGWCEGYKLEFTGKEERHLITRAFEENEDVAPARVIAN
ncbi:hypothetical protein PG993_008096 [Apiospora rasikravindrae]|uniref:Nudix hydrolase domain-containing protein n=1 Tax=Apiospora rasikravindrae TaxID=990691 RepID=A0ABR1SZD7_9PEZI